MKGELKIGNQDKIRKAKLNDLEDVMKLVKEFYDEELSKHSVSIDIKSLSALIQDTILNYIGIVAEKDGKIIGVIGGLISNFVFDIKKKKVEEIIWYVTKKERNGLTGIKLINAFEKECKNINANYIVMVRIGDSYSLQLDNFYKRKKYQYLETHYIKKL